MKEKRIVCLMARPPRPRPRPRPPTRKPPARKPPARKPPAPKPPAPKPTAPKPPAPKPPARKPPAPKPTAPKPPAPKPPAPKPPAPKPTAPKPPAPKPGGKGKKLGGLLDSIEEVTKKRNKTVQDRAEKALRDPLDSGRFTHKQLDKKYLKHASDFGINDTKKNRETLTKFRDAIEAHLADKETVKKGTYPRKKDSSVFFNPNTNNVVVIDNEGKFVTGWKLKSGEPQFKNFIDKGVLQ